MTERFIYSPETIIKAYSIGVFPMATAYDSDDIYFYEPDIRGIIPVCPPHIPGAVKAGQANTVDCNTGSRFSRRNKGMC